MSGAELFTFIHTLIHTSQPTLLLSIIIRPSLCLCLCLRCPRPSTESGFPSFPRHGKPPAQSRRSRPQGEFSPPQDWGDVGVACPSGRNSAKKHRIRLRSCYKRKILNKMKWRLVLMKVTPVCVFCYVVGGEQASQPSQHPEPHQDPG